MAHGFTKRQLESLDELFNTVVFDPLQNRLILPSALPPAPPPAPPSAPPSALCTPAPSELPPQPIPAPVATRSYPPSPCVEAIQEVEYRQIPLRNIGPMKKKLGASKTIPTSRSPFDEIYIEWPTTFGGSNLCFSRDEDLDAWYTTMLNTHANELLVGALPNRA